MTKKKFFIGLFIVTAIAFFIYAHIVLSHNKTSYEPQQNIPAPIEIPDTGIITYSETYNSEKPAVYMFYVDWCTYCKRFMPVFGELAGIYKDKYDFIVVNCDRPEVKNLVDKYHIMGFPSLFVVDNKIGHKFSLNMAGTVEKSIMKEELDNYLEVRKNILK